jgi:hypothetical protein
MNRKAQPIRARDLIDDLVGPGLEERARHMARRCEEHPSGTYDRPKTLRHEDRRTGEWTAPATARSSGAR